MAETGFSYETGDKYAPFYAGTVKDRRMVREWMEEFPDLVTLLFEDEFTGQICVRVPVDRIAFRFKKKRDLSDEQRQELAERMNKARECRERG